MSLTPTPQPTATVWHTLSEAAVISRRTDKALRQLRARGKGPKFRKVDGRLVVSDDDLQDWLAGGDDDEAERVSVLNSTEKRRHPERQREPAGADNHQPDQRRRRLRAER